MHFGLYRIRLSHPHFACVSKISCSALLSLPIAYGVLSADGLPRSKVKCRSFEVTGSVQPVIHDLNYCEEKSSGVEAPRKHRLVTILRVPA